MAKGCKDWLYDQDITLANHHQLAVDIHHIFPKKWCATNKIDELRRESIVNKTAISAATNRIIGGKAPSTYVQQLADRAGAAMAVIAERIQGHQIAFDDLSSDSFEAFFNHRRRALLDVIGEAMGKPIAEATHQPVVADAYDLDDEEPSDADIDEDVA